MVDFVWKRGNWCTINPLVGADLTAMGIHGNTVSLKPLCNDQSVEILGIWMATNGDQSKQFKILRQKYLAWGAEVSSILIFWQDYKYSASAFWQQPEYNQRTQYPSFIPG